MVLLLDFWLFFQLSEFSLNLVLLSFDLASELSINVWEDSLWYSLSNLNQFLARLSEISDWVDSELFCIFHKCLQILAQVLGYLLSSNQPLSILSRVDLLCVLNRLFSDQSNCIVELHKVLLSPQSAKELQFLFLRNFISRLLFLCKCKIFLVLHISDPLKLNNRFTLRIKPI